MSTNNINESSDDDGGIVDNVERDEMMKLTQVAKSWDFTCSFCFKKFMSAQALGGHQNAHRNERREEKRLVVKDPITYRKRNYLKAMRSISPNQRQPVNDDNDGDDDNAKRTSKPETSNDQQNVNNNHGSDEDGNNYDDDIINIVNAGEGGEGLVLRNFMEVKEEITRSSTEAWVVSSDAKRKAVAPSCIRKDEIHLDLSLKL